MLALLLFLGFAIAGQNSLTAAAPAAQDWDRYLDREAAVELYGLLQNYLMESSGVGGLSRPGAKRNSEIINSLLALPKSMADVGRR